MSDGRLVCAARVPGAPFPYQRPGVNTRTGTLYTKKETREAMRSIAAVAKTRCPQPELRDPLHVILRFFVHGRGGDVDNLCKTVLDALTGVVWRDDSQVLKLEAAKIRDCGAEHARTEIYVRRMLPGDKLYDPLDGYGRPIDEGDD